MCSAVFSKVRIKTHEGTKNWETFEKNDRQRDWKQPISLTIFCVSPPASKLGDCP